MFEIRERGRSPTNGDERHFAWTFQESPGAYRGKGLRAPPPPHKLQQPLEFSGIQILPYASRALAGSAHAGTCCESRPRQWMDTLGVPKKEKDRVDACASRG